MRVEPPPLRIRLRVLHRDARLRARGFESYDDFLTSAVWLGIVREYNRSDRPKRCICGSDVVEMHHLTYDRVGGDERMEDLTVLCVPCHRMLHVLERRDDIGLDPTILVDPARADEWRRLRAVTVIDLDEVRLAMFHDLPLSVRLARLLRLSPEDRAPIARELRLVRLTIRDGQATGRKLPVARLDRRVWAATEALIARRPRVLREIMPPSGSSRPAA